MALAVLEGLAKEVQSPCCDEHQYSRCTRGDEVHQIIELGGEEAIGTIALIEVADHRVLRIDHLIGEYAGCAEEAPGEHRAYDAVAEVLGECLQRCCTDLLGR